MLGWEVISIYLNFFLLHYSKFVPSIFFKPWQIEPSVALGANVGGEVEGVVLAPGEEGGQSLADLAAVPLYTRQSEDLQDPLGLWKGINFHFHVDFEMRAPVLNRSDKVVSPNIDAVAMN